MEHLVSQSLEFVLAPLPANTPHIAHAKHTVVAHESEVWHPIISVIDDQLRSKAIKQQIPEAKISMF